MPLNSNQSTIDRRQRRLLACRHRHCELLKLRSYRNADPSRTPGLPYTVAAHNVLVLIAQAGFILERGQTHTDKLTNALITLPTPRLVGYCRRGSPFDRHRICGVIFHTYECTARSSLQRTQSTLLRFSHTESGGTAPSSTVL